MNRRNFGQALILTLFGLLPALSASAHDFWLEPSNYHPQIAERFGIATHIGDQFNSTSMEVVPCLPCADKFSVTGPDGETDIRWLDHSDPTGTLQLAKAGTYVIGYRDKQTLSEMEPVQFEHYLADRGLLQIIELRKKHGATDLKGREASTHYMKSLVRIGDVDASDRILGMRYEIIADIEHKIPDDAGYSFILLFDGKPLKGALVRAMRRNTSFDTFYARSDASGRVIFKLKGAGPWLLTSVHMTQAPKDIKADWQSFWASLTLEL